MFKKIREFFRVLGELRYLIPLMRYEFPNPDDNASLAHSFEKTVTEFGSNNFIYFEMRHGLIIKQMKQLMFWQTN